jgi:hypothetical protein
MRTLEQPRAGVTAAPQTRPLTASAWARRVAASTIFLGLLVSIATWTAELAPPFPGVDGSWVAALNLAAHMELEWGTEVIHSYGPLGFLSAPPTAYYDGLGLLSLGYASLLHIALCCTLVLALRRVLPVVVAVILAFLLALAPFSDSIAVLALFWAVAALDSRSLMAQRLVVFAGGFLAALELLAKTNVGVEVTAIAVICVVALDDRRRNIPTFAITFAVTFLGLWLAAGQEIGTIPDYVRNSATVISGYSQAFSTEYQTGFRWQLPAAVLAVAALAGLAYLGRAPGPRRFGIAATLVAAVTGFAVFKEGFIRHDRPHAALFFWTILIAAALLSTRLERPRLLRAAPVLALLAVAAVVVTGRTYEPNFNPITHADNFGSSVRDVFSPARREHRRAVGAFYLKATYQLDSRSLRLLRGHTVHIDPWELGVMWAYGLRWDPLPVLQNEAYTPRLDDLNAAALSSPSGPERILRLDPRRIEPGLYPTAALDNRYPAHDSPAARLAMLCHYRAIRTTPDWQVLRRVPNRCSTPDSLDSVRTSYGTEVRVPAPRGRGEVVFARVHGAAVSGLERLRAFAYRAPARAVRFDGNPKSTYRLIPATAEDGLLMRTPPAADYPAPFSLGPRARTVTFLKGGSRAALTVDFYAIRVRPQN